MTERGIASFLSSTRAGQVEPGKLRERRGGRRQLQPIEVAVDDAKRRAASGEWDDARGSTLVGLYAFCHQLIYGLLPEELRELPTFRMAAKHAATFAHQHFDDDFGAVAVFVKWCWERENRRAAHARATGGERMRMSWRLQFSASLLTDWKVDHRRRRR